MKISKAIAALFLFIGSGANAYDFNQCTVEEIVLGENPKNGHVRLNCEITPRPSCAVVSTYFGFDKSTEEGKQIYSMVLTAFATGSTISGDVDDNSCPAWQGNLSHLTGSIRIIK